MSDVTTDEAGRAVGRPASVMPSAFERLHRDATAMLEAWRGPTPHEEWVRTRMLDVLEGDPTAMWRFHSRVHFTASLLVIDRSATHVALTLHAKARRWFQFGGHLEPADASVAAAALREGVEESGLGELRLLPGLLQVDAHALPPAFAWCREHLDLRFAAVTSSRIDEHARAGLSVSDESVDVQWFPIDALPDGTEDSLRDAVLRAAERVHALRENGSV